MKLFKKNLDFRHDFARKFPISIIVKTKSSLTQHFSHKKGTLSNAVAGIFPLINYEKIITLTITAGKVLEEDWRWLAHTGELDGLEEFAVDDTICCEDIPKIENHSVFPSSIKKVSIPTVVKIGGAAFKKCARLEDVNLSDVQFIGARCFFDCRSLKSINAPCVTVIESSAFENCRGLAAVCFPSLKTARLAAFKQSGIVSLVLNSAENIESDAFYGCTALQNIWLPKIAYIGLNAFNGCNLKKVGLPIFPQDSISYYAFDFCGEDAELLFINKDGTLVIEEKLFDAAIENYKNHSKYNFADNRWNNLKLPERRIFTFFD